MAIKKGGSLRTAFLTEYASIPSIETTQNGLLVSETDLLSNSVIKYFPVIKFQLYGVILQGCKVFLLPTIHFL